jgi:GTPase SAR1 family protein
VLQSSEVMSHCDVACLLFDTHDSRSFQHVAKIQTLLSEKYPLIPSVLLETKVDLASVQQTYEMNVNQFCAKYGLALPKKVSAKKGIDSEVYSDVVRRIYNR